MSGTDFPRAILEATYAAAAQDYLHGLPLEHFMEATAQAKQRQITLASLDLLRVRRPDVQVFNELLVQYPAPGGRQLRQIVPDNMVIIREEPIQADLSYDVPLQPVGPFWILDYVSRHNRRKDYEENFQRCERELRVPYYLVFHPEEQVLTFFHHEGRAYEKVRPNAQDRSPIPELDLEVALHQGWVRFWYQGQLLLLPADLQRKRDEARRQLAEATQRADQARQRAEQAHQRADQERQRAEQERQRAEQERQRAEQVQQRAEEAARQAMEFQRRLEQERQSRQALERELELLRARTAPSTPQSGDASERS